MNQRDCADIVRKRMFVVDAAFRLRRPFHWTTFGQMRWRRNLTSLGVRTDAMQAAGVRAQPAGCTYNVKTLSSERSLKAAPTTRTTNPRLLRVTYPLTAASPRPSRYTA